MNFFHAKRIVCIFLAANIDFAIEAVLFLLHGNVFVSLQ